MSIHINSALQISCINILIHSEESLANFKQLIQRGLNTWTQAPAELKEFGDMLIEGKVLQDYKAQEHSKPRSE